MSSQKEEETKQQQGDGDGSTKPYLVPLKEYHPPTKHDKNFTKVFDNIYTIKGQICMDIIPKYVSMNFSLLMTVIVLDNKDLVLINALRLNEDGLQQLDKLGNVKHVIKLAGFHGKDDPFYKARYVSNGVTIWAPKPTEETEESSSSTTAESGNKKNGGTCKSYVFGTDVSCYCNNEIPKYFEPDKYFTDETNFYDEIFSKPTSWLRNVTPILIKSSTLPEALVLLELVEKEQKIMISGDSLQNYMHKNGDEYFNTLAKWGMWAAGFMKPCNIGPPYYQGCKPNKQELLDLLNHKFDHLIPSHGDPWICMPASQGEEEKQAEDELDKKVPAYKKFEPNIAALPQY